MKKKGVFAQMKDIVEIRLCKWFLRHLIVWSTDKKEPDIYVMNKDWHLEKKN